MARTTGNSGRTQGQEQSWQDHATEMWERCTREKARRKLKQHIPILEWLPKYDIREDLASDLVAGITVGLILVPQEISLSTMMDVPPIYGLYTAALVPMIYPLFGTSRVLSVANGAEVSLLVGSAINKIEDEEERVATAILLSFFVGLMLILMGILRLGILADFFSRPVMGGFVSAGGVLIMLSQCANWFGVNTPSRDVPFITVLDLMEASVHYNMYSVALGAVSICVMLGMRALKVRAMREMRRLEDLVDEEIELESTRTLHSLDMETEASDSATDEESQQDRSNKHVQDSEPEAEKSTRNIDQRLDMDSVKSDTTDAWTHVPAVQSTRHRDLSSTRSARPATAFMDGGVGLSLSDEDFLNIELPRSNSWRSRRNMPTSSTTASMIILEDEDDPNDDSIDQSDDLEIDREQRSSRRLPTKREASSSSVVSSTRSDTASAYSTDALTKGEVHSIAPSSRSIRVARSKIAVLIALRLVCELDAFIVCLMGGIIGYLSRTDSDLELTGEVPGGYPSPVLPWYGFLEHLIEADRLYHIIIDTLSIALITYMSSVAMAKRLAIKEGYKIRPNQELIALGLSNLFGSFFHGVPATGGLSRTAVNMQNARTQVASLIAVGVVVLVLYTATTVLAFLPKASLAAIIIVSGHSLIEFKEAKWLYRVKRDEFWVWLASFVLTVLLGVLPGLLSSIFTSLVAVIYKARRPTLTMLGEVDTGDDEEPHIVDLELYPDSARALPDVVIIRIEGALYFANCEYIERVTEREIEEREENDSGRPVHGVVIDAYSTMEWDSTTLQMMKGLNEDLNGRGIQLAIVNARERLQSLLENTGFLSGIVKQDASISIVEAIDAIREMAKMKAEQLARPARAGSVL